MTARLLQCSGWLLALGFSPAFGQTAPPPRAPLAQNDLLLAARHYAARYLANLPSFICTQTTEQFEAGKKPKHWHKGDTLISQLVWDQGREQRTLKLVNNRPVAQHPIWRSPLVSEGEFGNLLDTVLGDSSEAVFQWKGWDAVAGKRTGVIEYRVDQQHSTLRLSLGSAETVVAFHGLIYADADNGTVWRITNEAENFPAELRTKSILRLVDYDEVQIAAKRYVLPVHATVWLDTGENNLRNELRFENYRKFEADSRISFSTNDLNTTPSEPVKR